jgi:hypothetical protein
VGIADSGIGSAPAGLADCCVCARLIFGISTITKIRIAWHKKVTLEQRLPALKPDVEFPMGIAPVVAGQAKYILQALISALTGL